MHNVEEDSPKESKPMPKWLKYTIITLIVLFCILLILFIAVFVVFPIVFMQTISLQRSLVFMNIQSPKDPNFAKPTQYEMEGVNNIYITVKDTTNDEKPISIGIWEIVPENLIDQAKNNKSFSYEEALLQSTVPVLLYLHGIACNRAKPTMSYNVLRKKFYIIAMDYRSYGDSSGASLSETGVVEDSKQIYEWLTTKTNANIYVWGHSLGTAISTHTVINLHKKIAPFGLILESPFTTLREEVPRVTLGKIFSWLPWFEATVLDPLEDNGFLFKTSSNILNVNCPIMILHAEDDDVIPYELGHKLYEIANKSRTEDQGAVIFHGFSADLNYKHLDINSDPHIPEYISEFIKECEKNDTVKRIR